MDDLLMRQDSETALGARLANATIVCDDRIAEGDIAIAGGHIVGTAVGGAPTIDFGGDYLVAGLIDLHTDNIEHHFQPRPGVKWPSPMAAALMHDWQILGSGITTVLDSLSIGDYDTGGKRTAMLNDAIAGVEAARAADLLKADHYFHFRCELSDPGFLPIIESHIDNPYVRLLSMMDHTPGQRQWHDLALYREFRRKKNNQVWTDEEFAAYMDDRLAKQEQFVPTARAMIGTAGRERQIVMASHDDTTVEDVEQSHGDGITISEFPTTLAAASRARALGQRIVMGSPNVVLGGSHSGNVGAMQLWDAGLLDVLTSDYVPASLLHAAYILAGKSGDLPAALRTVTSAPAALVGLADRGRIEEGLRADLLRVRVIDGLPVVMGIWAAGRRYM